ncbi:MAG TPA: 23S rRNA (adenine(2503)-C(2))-methyltransferase RlmN [Polyangiaceae bacterium]|jgi:23S rRNA (adenine2503-C2)-methyltransferase|nr:23S rRNA (adenine(2503)-C(2))-methyltransferase RlmN [Polyangiaceae bacterium]
MTEPFTELHPMARLPAEWEELAVSLGERAFRGRQVFKWVQARGVTDPSAMTDLPPGFRERLADPRLAMPLTVTDVRRARDGTRKLVCELALGGKIECVVIPMSDDPDDDPEDEDGNWDGRVTLCISTQIGCAMGCTFCASGQAGLERGLKAEEIIAQVLVARAHLAPGEHLRNLVFMGMGEPLHHYDETARAIRLLTHPEGIGMSPRRITVSTVGLVPGIRRLGEDFDGKVGLALSLHAPNDEVRNAIVPMNRRFTVRDVLDAVRAYPLPKRRRVTIEYILIAGVNDGPAHATELARVLRGLRVKVNLIPMNPISAAKMGSPEAARVETFKELLARDGYSVFVRKQRGDDVDAACGQLVLREKLERKARGNVPTGPGSEPG